MKRLQQVVVIGTCLGLLWPHPALLADDPPPAQRGPKAVDIALASGGTLEGAVRNADDRGVPGVAVALYQRNNRPLETVTAADGSFRFTKLSAGMHIVQAEERVVPVRAWAPGTAPPSSQRIVLVKEDPVVSGPPGSIWTKGRVAVALIAIAGGTAIAIHNANSDNNDEEEEEPTDGGGGEDDGGDGEGTDAGPIEFPPFSP